MKTINKTLRIIGAISFFTLLAILSPLMTTTVAAQITLQESNFRRNGDDMDRFVLSDTVTGADSDVIHLKIEKVPELRNKIEIVLAASSNVRWWKGITIFKSVPSANRQARYVRYKHIDTADDDKSESSTPINISDLGDSSYLTFEKAKAFGAHTPMYKFFLKEKGKEFKYAGYRLTFTWERDG